MTRSLKLMTLAAAVAVLIAVPGVDASTTQPTPSQIKAAITTATRSRQLWATINSCDSHGDHQVGIRGQMPALTFPAHLEMTVTVLQWSPTEHRYVPVKGSWTLGGQVFDPGSVVQEGISLRWSGEVTLIGHVRFEWIRDHKVLGAATLTTTAGHRTAAGHPSGFSVGTCSIT